MSFAPFIDGSYGIAIVFLIGAGALTYRRYRLAAKRLRIVDARQSNATQ